LEDDLNCFCLNDASSTTAENKFESCLLGCDVDDILGELNKNCSHLIF
jgi:hypothetical protein